MTGMERGSRGVRRARGAATLARARSRLWPRIAGSFTAEISATIPLPRRMEPTAPKADSRPNVQRPTLNAELSSEAKSQNTKQEERALSVERSKPALSRVEGPALSKAEGPALSKAEGPALSKAEGPALSKAEGPALSKAEGLRVESSPPGGPPSPSLWRAGASGPSTTRCLP